MASTEESGPLVATHILSGIRYISLMVGCASAISSALYQGPHDCHTGTWGVALAITSAVFSLLSIALIWSRKKDDGKNKSFFENTIVQEMIVVLASVFLFVSFVQVYRSQFDKTCTTNTSADSVILRHVMLLGATLQTGCIIAYGSFQDKSKAKGYGDRPSAGALVVSAIGAVLAVCGVVAYFMHGGRTAGCTTSGTPAPGAATQSPLAPNSEGEEVYRGVIITTGISSIALMAGYFFEREQMRGPHTTLVALAGTALSLVTYFFLTLIIYDPTTFCPFVLDSHERNIGNASIYLTLIAIAVQHAVPVASHKFALDNNYSSVPDSDVTHLGMEVLGSGSESRGSAASISSTATVVPRET